MKLSVVIPVFRDRQELTRLVDVLRGLDPQPYEIIVVEGEGEGGEAIEDLCLAANCRLLSSPPRRGEQMDRGARAARGDVLWFLHADAEPPPESLAIMRAHLSSGAIGGWFRFRFRNETCWQAKLLAGLVNLRARLGVPYGDQGLFMSREAYRQAGGFPWRPLFEEPPLVRRLRKLGRFQPLQARLGVSARRWRRDGWFRRSLTNRLLALAYMLRLSPEKLARRYFRRD